MPSFSFSYQQHLFTLVVDPAQGTEQLLLAGEPVSSLRQFAPTSEHSFTLAELGELRLQLAIDWPQQQLAYRLWLLQEGQDDLLLQEGQGDLQAPGHVLGEVSPPMSQSLPRQQTSWLSLGLVAFKLIKAVNVFKVALLGASVAAYSVMFTLEFALALIAVLVFHEYGHLRAMKKCGLPTKGMYLIPFVGGLAVGDSPKTRWQDVYISLMGPVYGLLMTLVFYGVYLATGSHFAGLVASTSALINLFNLIPVHPLDGGRVVKALVFSGRNYLALVALLAISAACFALAWKLGLFFITFFIVLGAIDIFANWKLRLAEDITPLNRYGIAFCLLWYLAVVAMFIGLILLIAGDALPGSEIAVKVLAS